MNVVGQNSKAAPTASATAVAGPPPHAVVLYDGLCGLCDRYVQFLLRHDNRRVFRFAPLQGVYAAHALARQGFEVAATPSTVVLLEHPQSPAERLRFRSDAVLAIVSGLGGLWRLAAIFRLVPRPVRDMVYDWVARIRYRVFGKLEACAVPPAGSDLFLP